MIEVRVLVTFAVEAEFAPWRALRQFVKRSDGTAEFYSAQIGGAEVNILLSSDGRWGEERVVGNDENRVGR